MDLTITAAKTPRKNVRRMKATVASRLMEGCRHLAIHLGLVPVAGTRMAMNPALSHRKGPPLIRPHQAMKVSKMKTINAHGSMTSIEMLSRKQRQNWLTGGSRKCQTK